MPSLDTIPPEIFREVGSYLAFFDKASLSLTSKRCRALLGPFDCPDYTSWAAYLCINAHCYPSYQQIYVIPETATLYLSLDYIFSRHRQREMLLKTFERLEWTFELYYCSVTKQEWLEDPNVGGLGLEKPTKPRSWSQALALLRPSPLLSHYFPGLEYPECTLAHFYMKRFKEILEAAKLGSKQKESLKEAEEEVGRRDVTAEGLQKRRAGYSGRRDHRRWY